VLIGGYRVFRDCLGCLEVVIECLQVVIGCLETV